MTWRKQLLYQLGLLAVAIFALLPVWLLAYLAFDGGVRGWPTEFRLWPQTFTLEVFERVWQKPAQTLDFVGLLQNSLGVAGGAAWLSVALGASMAYAFARWRFPGQEPGLFALLVGAFLPPVALMTPLFILLSWLGIRTTLWGLMVVYTAMAMPFCVWNMRAAFRAVPLELEEAAWLDGATPWVAFWRISLPLALPAIAVGALLAFLIGYSEFALGWLFVDKPGTVTLAMAISGMMQNLSTASWSSVAALCLLMSAPVVAVFVLLQHTLLRGVVPSE